MSANKSYEFVEKCRELYGEKDVDTLFETIHKEKTRSKEMESVLKEMSNTDSRVKRFFKNFDAKSFFGSPQVVLLISTALLLAQSFHTWHFFYTMSFTRSWAGFVFAVITSVFIDGLILFFVSRGAKFYSVIAMACTVMFNIYSYMVDGSGKFVWGSNNILFTMIASVAVPFFLHGVGVELSKISQNKNED